MKKNLQKRRDLWLKLPQTVLDNIHAIYGNYLETEIEKYAQLKLAQSRQKDLSTGDENWGRGKDIALYSTLAVLGALIFAGLPRLLLRKTGIDDNLLMISSGIAGIIATFFSHNLASSFFEKKILFDQYKTTLEQLIDEEKLSSYSLNNAFLQNQQNFLKRTEKFIAKPLSINDYLSITLAVLIESAAVYFIFTLNDKSPNPWILGVAMTFPIYILLVISRYTAMHKEVPVKNEKLRVIYGQLETEIDEFYDNL